MRKVAVAAVLASMVFCGGCFNRTRSAEREPFTERMWQQAVQENDRRLLSEDERRAQTPLGAVADATRGVGNAITHFWNWATGNTPFQAARKVLDPASADNRREGIYYLAARDFGRDEPYTQQYIHVAQTEPDHTVRAAAIRALNRSRERQVIDLYVRALTDEHELVRLEAAKALANMPAQRSVAPLIQRLQDQNENVDVRVAAADALRNHASLETAQALIGVLRARNFAISWQARQSLRLMTGVDHRYDQAAWLRHLTEQQDPFAYRPQPLSS